MERKLISEADSRPLVVLDPRAPASPDALDAAVRAAGSLLLHFARRTGCALLLPGDRRARRRSSPTCSPGRSAHVRLALLDDRTGPALAAAQNRRGLVVFVAARPSTARRAGSAARPAAACSSCPASCPAAAPCSRSPAATATSARPTGGAAAVAARRRRARERRRRPRRARRRPARAAPSDPTLGRAAPARARRSRSSRSAAFGALHWMPMLEPAAPGARATRCSPPALAICGAARRRRGCRAPARGRRRRSRSRRPAVALALLGGGVADELLLPGRWGELAGGICARHLRLPGVRVPYRGLDEWTRTVIPLGGTALVVARRAARVLAAARAARASRRSRCSLLIVALRRAGRRARLRRRVPARRGVRAADGRVPAAGEAAPAPTRGAAGGARRGGHARSALIAAPALNRDPPWFDYETWARRTPSSKSTSFTWDHSYGAAELAARRPRAAARASAKRPAYWKAENLDELRRRAAGCAPQLADLDGGVRPTGRPARVERWTQEIKVSMRNLRTPTSSSPRATRSTSTSRGCATLPPLDGIYVAHAHAAPRRHLHAPTSTRRSPTGPQRRAPAPTTRVDCGLPRSSSARSRPGRDRRPPQLASASSSRSSARPGQPRPARSPTPTVPGAAAAAAPRRRSRRTYALAQRLEARARDAGGLRAARAALPRRRRRSPTPRRRRRPPSTLDGFLFDAKPGYCQQYSGAMALLLRMGGVPARVATGFSTGAIDRKTGEYVVRDLDAHSWVEVWYPGLRLGDVRPDAGGRARALAAPTTPTGAGRGRRAARRTSAATSARPQPRRRRAVGERDAVGLDRASAASPCSPLAARRAVARRRRRRRARRAAGAGRRARARAARAPAARPAPARRCSALERRFARTPAAAGYVRALREQRYGDAPAAPTPRAAPRPARPSSRAAAGSLGRLRAWWALPPRAASRAAYTDASAMDDVYDLFQRGMALLEAGDFNQATVPLAQGRATSSPTRPRSARRSAARTSARAQFEQARGGVRGRRRARADQRLRAVLPRPLADAARPPRRRPASRSRSPPTCARTGATTGIYRDRARKAA